MHFYKQFTFKQLVDMGERLDKNQLTNYDITLLSNLPMGEIYPDNLVLLRILVFSLVTRD